jgi:hypothetical protein
MLSHKMLLGAPKRLCSIKGAGQWILRLACIAALLPMALLGSGHRSHTSNGAERSTKNTAQANDTVKAFATTSHRLRRDLTYKLDTSRCFDRCQGGAEAVADGFRAWDVSGFTLSGSNAPAIDPCTHTPNSITWAPINGPGKTIALTHPCFNSKTGELLGFQLTFDSATRWSDCIGVATCRQLPHNYSIAAVAAHEGGHIYGLDHAPGTLSSRLTMSSVASPGDYGHATLGCGDRLGINELYKTHLQCVRLPGD